MFLEKAKEKYEKEIYEKKFEISKTRRLKLAKYLKELRESKKISIPQLADLTEINISDLYKIERGTRNKLNPFHLKVLAEVLDADYKEFYKIVNYLNEEDTENGKVIYKEKFFTKKELLEEWENLYPKEKIGDLLRILENLSEIEKKEVLLFAEYLKSRK